MSEQQKKTEKKRNSNTLTSMYRAIEDLGQVIAEGSASPTITITRSGTDRFIVALSDGGADSATHAAEGATVEECLSGLVDFQRGRLDEEKDRRLKTINEAMSRHQGVVRAARSRVQKK